MEDMSCPLLRPISHLSPTSAVNRLNLLFHICLIILPAKQLADQVLTSSPFSPRFLPTPVNVSTHRGQEAVLRCAVENKGARTVVWRKASEPHPLTIGEHTYIADARVKVTHQTHSLEWNLHIQDVQHEDSGVYECQVVAKGRNIRQFVTLKVEAAGTSTSAKTAINIRGTLFVERGDTLTLVCNATGSEYPPDDIDWFKDGDRIKNSERASLTKDVSLSDRTIVSSLHIRRGNMNDAGTYVCRTSDLQVTSAKVNILNTGTNNEKRESAGATGVTPHDHGTVGVAHVTPTYNSSPRILVSATCLHVTVTFMTTWLIWTMLDH